MTEIKDEKQTAPKVNPFGNGPRSVPPRTEPSQAIPPGPPHPTQIPRDRKEEIRNFAKARLAMQAKIKKITVQQYLRAMILLWVLGGVTFGLWQHSITAGVFMFVLMIMISRKM